METAPLLIFELAILIFSVMIHEISHGYIAEYLGDPTARLAGRLTLNPLKHIDFFGSFLLPLMLYVLTAGTFVFGWAKPVPYNPNNLKNPAGGGAKIAAAGPISNLAIAAIFGVILRIFSAAGFLSPALVGLLGVIIYMNVLLAIFNLVPIPPLDGSKVLFAFLPKNEAGQRIIFFLERYGMMLVILFIFFGFQLITPVVDAFYAIFAGRPFGF